MVKEVPKADQEFLDQFEPDVFWEEHGPKIMGALLVIVVVGLGIFLWQRHKTEQAREASERLAAAQDATALEAILQTYPRTEVAAQAVLRLADLHYRQGKYDDAATHYQSFLEQFPSHTLVPSAQLSLAAVHEAQKKYQEALNEYQRIPSSPSTAYLAGLAKLGAGRSAEALGQYKEARQFYEEAMAMTQGTPLHANAVLRFTVIGRMLDEESTAAPGQAPVSSGMPSITAPAPESVKEK